MNSNNDLYNKISKLSTKDLNSIYEDIFLLKWNHSPKEIVDYINDAVSSTGIANLLFNSEKPSFSLQQFFIDTVHFLLENINNDNKLIEKYSVCIDTSNQLLQLINDYKDKPTDDLCITLVSRLFLLFNTADKDDLPNHPNIKTYINNNFDSINKKIISIIDAQTSIFSDNVIEQDTETRKLEKSAQKSFNFDFLKDKITESFKGELSLDSVKSILPYFSSLDICKKYNNLMSNSKYIKIFHISLLIYENEYINYKNRGRN